MFVSALAQFILKNRLILFFFFFGFNVFCDFPEEYQYEPGFEKTLPIEHPYIKTFFDYREIFGMRTGSLYRISQLLERFIMQNRLTF